MVKLLASAALSLVSLVPVAAPKHIEKPPLADGDSVIVKIMPHRAEKADGNYIVEGETNADTRYEELKKALDERFSHMFELKAKLDKYQSVVSAKWDEYYVLHEQYNRELKKIIASWVTENNYLQEK